MAFGREPAVVAVKVQDIEINLFDGDPAGTQGQRATVTVQVKMSNGDVLLRTVNLVDVTTQATINQLIALAATLRTRANAEILPTP